MVSPLIPPQALGPTAKLTRASLVRAVSYFRPYAYQLAAYGLLILAATAGLILVPFILRIVLDHALPHHDLRAVARVSLLAGMLFVGSAVLYIVAASISGRVSSNITFDLRSDLIRQVQKQSLAFFTHTSAGALQSRVLTDVFNAQQLLTASLNSLFTNVIALVLATAAMWVLSVPITLLVYAIAPVYVLSSHRVSRRLRALNQEQMTNFAGLTSVLAERLSVRGAVLTRLFPDSADDLRPFEDPLERVRSAGGRLLGWTQGYFWLLSSIGTGALVGVYWLGGRAVIQHSLTVGTIVALSYYVQRVYGPIGELTNFRATLSSGLLAFERVFEVVDAKPSVADPARPAASRDVRGELKFDHVSFRFPSPWESTTPSLAAATFMAAPHDVQHSDFELRDIAFVAKPGTVTALVGATGAGKSTICMLTSRLYDPSTGSIFIDGCDLRELSLRQVARSVGVVTQEPFLFHDTVAANLRLARPNASNAQLERACEAAQVHDVISRLPNGYETTVGDWGYRFSGGEKQRLAIARVLLLDPPIVIFDEATAHLDAETEVRVRAAVSNLFAERTVLVVAHRLSTVEQADQILVLDRGCVVDRGTHGELRGRGGMYAQLYGLAMNQAAPEDRASVESQSE